MSELENVISVMARSRFRRPDSTSLSTAKLKFSTLPSTSNVGLVSCRCLAEPRRSSAVAARIERGGYLPADLPVLRQITVIVSRCLLGGFAFFDELLPSGHLHAATGDLAGQLDLSGASSCATDSRGCGTLCKSGFPFTITCVVHNVLSSSRPNTSQAACAVAKRTADSRHP